MSLSWRRPVRAACALLACWTVTGCGHVSSLEAHVHELEQLTQQARARGAYRCAPEELAEAESQVEFAARELREGDPPRAREHLTLARANAHAALRLSADAACTGPRSYAPEAVRNEALIVTTQLVSRRGSTKEHAAI